MTYLWLKLSNLGLIVWQNALHSIFELIELRCTLYIIIAFLWFCFLDFLYKSYLYLIVWSILLRYEWCLYFRVWNFHYSLANWTFIVRTNWWCMLLNLSWLIYLLIAWCFLLDYFVVNMFIKALEIICRMSCRHLLLDLFLYRGKRRWLIKIDFALIFRWAKLEQTKRCFLV